MSELMVERREASRMAGKVHCWTLRMRLLRNYAGIKTQAMTDAAAVLSSCRSHGTPISWTGNGIPMGWWFFESRGDGSRADHCVGFFEL